MGYACPVCETPQADAGHLANHLAFTAMLGDDDHEVWLDEHAPGWSEEGERALADRIVGYATEVEFPQVFEDTTDGDPNSPHHDHVGPDEDGSGTLFDDERSADRSSNIDTPDHPEIERTMAEARELTRKRHENDEGEHERHTEEDDGDGHTDENADRTDGAENQ